MIGIYKITSPSGKVYIGQSVNILERFSAYKRLQCKGQHRLYNSFLKYGVENHTFEALTECNESELNNLERYYQDLYEAIGDKGLNCILTKSDNRSGKMSNDIKEKQSKAAKKRYENIEERLKSSEIQKKRYENIEEREKISKRQKEYYANPEMRKMFSDRNKGLKRTDDQKQKISESQKKLYENGYINPNKGIKRKFESNKKQSESMKKRYENGLLVKNAKQVINTQNGFMYNSSMEAFLASGLKYSSRHFRAMLEGKKTNKTNYEYC